MTAKMISVSLPQEMLPEIDNLARREHRSRSELIREALRRYLSVAGDRMIPLDDPEADEVKSIGRGRQEFKRGEFVRLEDLQNELGLPTR
jgi:Arc/MetJ-type ribon-helix-helix transcriptional regulator